MNNNLIQPVKFINPVSKNIFDSNVVEFWKPITSLVVGKPIEEYRFWISSMGRAYDNINNKFMSISYHHKGYQQLIFIDITNNKMITRKLHRIVMLTFAYFPGCENLQVNHIDGEKTHNWISNLEWSSESENRIHAINNDLENTIFGSPIVKLTPDEVWDIKLLHSQGIYSYNQIIDILGLREKGTHRKLIERIVNGKSKLYSGDYR